MWDEPRNSQLFTRTALREAQRLIDLAATWNMHMALRPGVNTLESTSSKNYTRPDNVWINEELLQNVIQCDVLPDQRPVCTDHLPITTVLDISPSRHNPPPRLNWRDVDWPKLVKDMEAELSKLPIPHTLRSIIEFDQTLEKIHQHTRHSHPKAHTSNQTHPLQKTLVVYRTRRQKKRSKQTRTNRLPASSTPRFRQPQTRATSQSPK